MITAEMVKTLRERTGAGMMDCKKALTATEGNMDKAIDFLREKGLAAAAKKADRIATDGLVESYIHAGGRIGVLVEINCETDFVAKTDDFKTLVKDIDLLVKNPTPNMRELIKEFSPEAAKLLKEDPKDKIMQELEEHYGSAKTAKIR